MYVDQKFEIFHLNVVDAIAFFVFFIAPDKKLFLPLFTAKLIASSMLIGSCYLATEEFNNTPSKPNSIILHASLGLPIPASTKMSPLHIDLMISRLCSFLIPRPEPIGEINGITTSQPKSSSLLHNIGSSEQ